MPRKKQVTVSDGGFVQLARFLSGPQVRERFVQRLRSSHDVVIHTLMDVKMPVDVWDKAVKEAAEGTDGDFKIPGLCEYRHFLGDTARDAFAASNVTPGAIKPAHGMKGFEAFVQVAHLCIEGVLPVETVQTVYDWLPDSVKESVKYPMQHVMELRGKK